MRVYKYSAKAKNILGEVSHQSERKKIMTSLSAAANIEDNGYELMIANERKQRNVSRVEFD